MSEILRKKDMKDKIDFLLNIAKEYAPDIFITAFGGEDALTRFGENEITQNVSRKSFSADILLAKDKKATKVQTDIMDEEKIRKQFEAAMKIIDFQKANPDFPEFPSDIKYIDDIPAFDEKTAFMNPEERADIIATLSEKCEKQELLASGTMSSGYSQIAIANSKGLFAYYESTKAEFSATAMDDEGHSGWVCQSANSFSDVNIPQCYDIVINKALMSKNPADLDTGKYKVILEPAAVADLLLFLSYIGFSTQRYHENSSPFNNKLGEKIFSDKISIIDNAYNQINPGIPFDLEGNKRQMLTLVEEGVFKNLPMDLIYGKKMGKESTGHGFSYPNSHGPICANLNLVPGQRRLDDIIENTDKALLITHFHYTNIINPNDLTITGMTRDGIYLVENGQIKNPVKNMRFTESVIRALNNVVEVSAEQDFSAGFFGGGFVVPGLVIDDFTFSSKTDY